MAPLSASASAVGASVQDSVSKMFHANAMNSPAAPRASSIGGWGDEAAEASWDAWGAGTPPTAAPTPMAQAAPRSPLAAPRGSFGWGNDDASWDDWGAGAPPSPSVAATPAPTTSAATALPRAQPAAAPRVAREDTFGHCWRGDRVYPALSPVTPPALSCAHGRLRPCRRHGIAQ